MLFPPKFLPPKAIVGMLHVPALPGSPRYDSTLVQITEAVLADVSALAGAGLDALMLENFGDIPFYPGRVPAHTVAFLAALAKDVRNATKLPLGINVLRNDALSALAVAAATGASFIRVNVFTAARLTDQGIIEGVAHEILRYRQTLGAAISIFADVDVKHSAPLAARSLREEVEDTVHRGLADAIIVSGAGTGKPTRLDDVQRAKEAGAACPVFVGSGVDAGNVAETLQYADGVIVGTALKKEGCTTAPVDPGLAAGFVEAARKRMAS